MKGESWGYKTGWIAVRSDSQNAGVNALGLAQTVTSNWEDGVTAAYRSGQQNNPVTAFVTPSINGWVLVHSCSYLDLCDGQA